MVSSRTFWTLTAAVLSLIVMDSANAAVISGTIETVTPDTKKIVIQTRTGKQTFSVPDSTTITLDGKTAPLKTIRSGQQISVFTSSSGAVTKLVVRSASTSPKTESTTPEPTPKPKPAAEKPKAAAGSSTKVSDSEAGNSDGDSPQFRGANRDGRAGNGNIAHTWPNSGPRPHWAANGLGAGYAAPSVADGRVFVTGLAGNDEKVLAFTEKDGRPLWSVSTGGEAYRDGTGDGPRCTPTVDGEFVYALGCFGDLVCLNAKTGQRRWHKNILKEFRFGNRTITWGICESVLIDGDKLICTPGGQDGTMVALNKSNGDVLWKCQVPGSPAAGYASAIAIEVGGVRQYVNFTSRSLIGVRASDGELLWENRLAANGTANCSAPVFWNNHVFYASGYGTGGCCLRLESNGNTTRAEEIYKTRDMKNHHGGMVVVDGFVYGCDENILTCLDMLSGKVMWQNRSVGKGSITFADGMLIVRSENGPLALVEANSQRYVEKGRFDQPRRSDRPSWAYPVVANGKLLLRDLDTLLCYDLRR